MLDVLFVVPVAALLLLWYLQPSQHSPTARETNDNNLTGECRRNSDLGPQVVVPNVTVNQVDNFNNSLSCTTEHDDPAYESSTNKTKETTDNNLTGECRPNSDLGPQGIVQNIIVNRVKNFYSSVSSTTEYDNPACESSTNKGGIKLDWTCVNSGKSHSFGLQEQKEKEQTMNEELVEIIGKLNQHLEAKEERDQRDQKERKQISSVIETLQNQLKEGEEKVRSMEQRLQTTRRSMSQQHKKEMEEEHDKVSTFIFKLEQRDKHLSYDVVDKIEDDQLRRAASVLVQEYNVRLLAIDSGLNFILDIPQREQSIIEARKLEIGEVLKMVFPSNLRQEVRFEAPTPMVLKQSICPNAENQYGKRSRTTANMNQGPCDTDVKPEAELARNQRSTDEVPGCDDSVFGEGKEDPPEVKKSDQDRRSTEVERKHSARQQLSGDRKRKPSVYYSEKARPMDTFEPAEDIQIENLKAKIRELEEELKSEKTRHVDKLHVKLRNDDERMLSVSFPFFSQKGTMGSVFDALLPVDLAKNADILGRLQSLKVSLQGVFLNYSLDEDGNTDDSLAFVLQTSMADFQKVKGHQQEIREVLAEILQGTQICWSDMAAGIFPTIPMKERRWSSPARQHPKHL